MAPDFSKEFAVQVDASEVGFATVLTQISGDEEHPVLYLSWKLLPREIHSGSGDTQILPSWKKVHPNNRSFHIAVDGKKQTKKKQKGNYMVLKPPAF